MTTSDGTWARHRLKEFFRERDERAGVNQPTLLALTQQGLVPRREMSQRASVAEDYGDYKRCRPGMLVMNKMQAWNGAFAVAGVEGMVSPDYTVFEPSGDIGIRFFGYLFKTGWAMGEFRIRARGMGTGFLRLNSDDFLSTAVYAPPVAQRHAIAASLDRETAKLDTLIARKERLLALLEEKRTALITRAVTKGLDPAVPMKESGVEWLGEVPAHWDVKRVKFVARLKTGHTPSRQHPEYWVDCSIPWFGLADVWQIRDGDVEYVTETAEQISQLGLANSAAELLPKGTVILSRTASVGFSAILGVDMATTQDFVNWVPGPKLRAEYLLYVFRSMVPEFRRITMGSTHQTIYWPDVGRLVCPVPPLKDQDTIVAHIRKQCARLDALTARTREAITLYREYRTALISAAVTGQIEARNGTEEKTARFAASPADSADLEQ